MNRLQRASLLSLLTARLIDTSGWCNEASIQKATFFLQELLGVPTGYHFVLYKYGPLSFDLSDELTAMRADGFLELGPHPTYGSVLIPTALSGELRKRYARTIGQFEPQLHFVVERLGGERQSKLDLLATAYYVWTKLGGTPPDRQVSEIQDLMPHITVGEAREALDYVRHLTMESKDFVVQGPIVVG